MKKQILERLKKFEKEKGIKILLAVESGSREWGFASKDSDYDIRCVHVSKLDKYLGLEPIKEQFDIIEGDIDIVSWDIRKFFNLFIKSNPTVSEWLSSRIIYVDRKFGKYSKENIVDIFRKGVNLTKLEHHYLSLARQNYEKYINIKSSKVSLKKYVYILRALGNIEYIKKKRTVPPLNWRLSSKYLPENIKKEFQRFVELKKSSEENKGARKKKVDQWVEAQFRQEFYVMPQMFDLDKINEIVLNTINHYK